MTRDIASILDLLSCDQGEDTREYTREGSREAKSMKAGLFFPAVLFLRRKVTEIRKCYPICEVSLIIIAFCLHF